MPPATSPREAARNGMLFYSRLQAEDGHWTGDCGGPLFFMAGICVELLLISSVFHRRRKGGWSPPNIFLEGAEPPQYFRPDSC